MMADERRSLDLLAMNWRDPEHPEAGGAEVHLHELLRRFVIAGHRVTCLASGFRGGAAETVQDGVRVLRRGRWFDANWALRRAYLGELAAQRFDLLIEDINKIPFFTPRYARSPVLAVVPHLFGTTVFREASLPLAAYVYLHELMIPWVYRHTDFLVISESTRADLIGRGLSPERVRVVPVGLDHDLYRPDPSGRRSAAPLVVYLGRIRRYKGVQDLVGAMRRVRARVPEARLQVVGDGPYRGTIERLVAGMPGVEVTGFVSREVKLEILRRAWVAVYPSAKEGFGLTVIEAGACGTPVVATRVPGLQDAVAEGESGLLVPHADQEALATAILRVLEEPALRQRLGQGGRAWAQRFTWDEAARQALEVVWWAIERAAARRRGGGG